ncbi:OsmC family protein [Candidatus Magnetominusculus xianensis]|uniref:Osmotically inducible protein OsmC n=1 Tax=Candidatus Magnetominusculus xianensis TaxID=1748249 RepID=A0ABR5SLC0_9BACT|nr:OsmC family protein [Candidatus Magnetominusculus xianensis]KWT90931.1 osmotically inducible protein OsmC [Candidatus Magnetominusculus xianensis]MBF0403087.1 OsmC family protein [Nitrospirota bacterium]
MKAKLTYINGMKFVAEADSGHAIVIDGDHENGGDDSGMRPSELLLIATGGCSAMDVISILKKKKQEVTGFEINVSGDKAATHPKRFQKVIVEYVVRGKNISDEAVKRAIELSMTKYCSVKATIEGGVPVEYTHRIIEE